MNRNVIIRLSRLSFAYSPTIRIFDDLSFDFCKGEFYLVKGLSCAGKSTLLRLLNRLVEPAAGEILYHGKPLTEYHAPLLRKKILYVQQTPAVIPGSVRENLLLPFAFQANQDLHRPDDAALSAMLASFHLPGIDLERPVGNLSVGQLQRICLIRGFLLNPEVILLDEPTSALDDSSAKVVETKAEAYCKDHQATIIMVSHRPFSPEYGKARMITLAQGGIMEEK
jgi:putative ABC transport system ATP-binding protein